MAFHHRKTNTSPYEKTPIVQLKEVRDRSKPSAPGKKCSVDCNPTTHRVFQLPPPPSHDGDQMSSTFILIFCIFAASVGVFSCLAIVKCYSNWRNSRRRNPEIPPTFDVINEDFTEADLGPVLDHPIWYINTIGIQQSVINSITIFNYKKDERIIEGTECSVCLSEFQEDESLRLLPKCSHAFHIPCIDTWLRSHKNCPLCRAPIVCDSNNGHLNTAELSSNDLGSYEETQLENLENSDGGLGSHQVGEGGTSEVRVGADALGPLLVDEEASAEILEKNTRYFSTRNCNSRVRSDLADYRLKVEEELQPRRRSVSMDSPSASMIYLTMASIPPVENEGCWDSQLVQVNKPNREMVLNEGK